MEAAKLVEFERAVYCRPHVDRLPENAVAMVAMNQCLCALREGAGFEDGMDTANITRMASAIVALFCDPLFNVTQEGFDYICANRAVMDTVFRASVFNGSDFVFSTVTDTTPHINKYLLLLSIGSESGFDFETMFRKDPQATFGLYLSLVSYGQVLSPAAHARREQLLELAPLFENVVPSVHLLNTLCSAYMHCSYASGPNKHAFKATIHKMMAKMLSHIEPAPNIPQLRKARPRLLVIHEWWHSVHAMYRSYSKSIQQLRRDFYVIGLRPGNDSDDASKAIFDEWVEVEGKDMNLSAIAEQVKALRPDIIYYPSIGMAIWSIAMASLRLAPIQVMTYGHPATSKSPVIDYGLIEADCYVEKCFSEHVIPLPPGVVRPTAFMSLPQKHVPRVTDTVRIGVAAMQVKVSWPLIRALQEVQKRATKVVEIHFFAAAHGVGLFSLCREVCGLLDNAVAQEKQTYDAYMESLHQMDLLLFSFPFGGANSMYDALTLGVPMVSMEGDEPHSRSDASIIRRAGLPESLIAHSEAEYVEIILRLLDDPYRWEIARQVRAVDVESQFYTPDGSTAFVDAFAKIYQENTVVQVSDFPIFATA